MLKMAVIIALIIFVPMFFYKKKKTQSRQMQKRMSQRQGAAWRSDVTAADVPWLPVDHILPKVNKVEVHEVLKKADWTYAHITLFNLSSHKNGLQNNVFFRGWALWTTLRSPLKSEESCLLMPQLYNRKLIMTLAFLFCAGGSTLFFYVSPVERGLGMIAAISFTFLVLFIMWFITKSKVKLPPEVMSHPDVKSLRPRIVALSSPHPANKVLEFIRTHFKNNPTIQKNIGLWVQGENVVVFMNKQAQLGEEPVFKKVTVSDAEQNTHRRLQQVEKLVLLAQKLNG